MRTETIQNLSIRYLFQIGLAGIVLMANRPNEAHAQTVQIGSGISTEMFYKNTLPITYYRYSYSQQIIQASEYSTGGGFAGEISKIRWKFSQLGTNPTANYGDWDVWIGHTTKTTFSSTTDWVSTADLTQIYSGNIHDLPIPPTAGEWFEIEFSTPFTYNGTDNLVVAVREKKNGSSETGQILTYTSSSNTGMVWRTDGHNANNNFDLANLPTAHGRTAILAQLQLVAPTISCSDLVSDQTFSAGTVTISPTIVEVGTPYTVMAEDFSMATGISYIWEKSIDNETTWTQEYNSTEFQPIENALAPLTPGTKLYYRLRVACASDTLSSDVVMVKTAKYCIPKYNNDASWTSEFKTTNLSEQNNILYTANSQQNNGYLDLTEDAQYLLSRYAGEKIVFSHAFGGSSAHHLRMWIDWNNDGQFDEDSEQVYESESALGNPKIDSFTISPNKLPGTYTIRVRSRASFNKPGPCSTESGGQAMDFTLTILPSSPCSGTPNAGTVSVNPNSGNPNTTHTVTATQYDYNLTGLSYIWESSIDQGTTWEEESSSSYYQDLNAQPAPSLGNAIWYRLKIICEDGAIGYSNVDTFITSVSYCQPSYIESSDYTQEFFTLGALMNINYVADQQTGTNGYNDLSATPTLLQEPGGVFDFFHGYVGSIPDDFQHTLRIWVDWGNDGTFDESDEVFNQYSGMYSGQSGMITIPLNTFPNTYRMRVRSVWENNPVDPCSQLNYGQALDFLLNIQNCPLSNEQIDGESTLCYQDSTQLTATQINGVWSSEHSYVASVDPQTGYVKGQSLEHNTTTIRYTILEGNNCVSKTLKTITVKETPALSLSPDVMICKGEQTTLIASGAGQNGTYTWDNGISDTGAEQIVSPSASTTYMVIATGENGCNSMTNIVTVTVNELPILSLSPYRTICKGEQTTISATGAGTNGIYSWDNENYTAQQTVAPTKTTTYTVIGMDENGCSSKPKSVTITVKTPIEEATITQGAETITVDDEQTYLGIPVGGTWSSSDSTIATIDKNTGKLTALKAGTVELTYIVNNVAPCTGSVSAKKTITIEEKSAVGVNDIAFVSHVSLFPNPATNELTVQFSTQQIADFTIEVLDMNGRILNTQKLFNVAVGINAVQLDVSTHARGVYSVVVRSNDVLAIQQLVLKK